LERQKEGQGMGKEKRRQAGVRPHRDMEVIIRSSGFILRISGNCPPLESFWFIVSTNRWHNPWRNKELCDLFHCIL
jgi:hypothetical protein